VVVDHFVVVEVAVAEVALVSVVPQAAALVLAEVVQAVQAA